MTNKKDLEDLFYLNEGWILVGLHQKETEDLEEQLRKDVSEFGYEVPRLEDDPREALIKRLGGHLLYWFWLKCDLQHFERRYVNRFLEVKVEPGQEEEAINQLMGIPYVMFAERMYGMHTEE